MWSSWRESLYMPCHDCGIYSKHLCIVYHDACETIFCVCMLYNAVFVYLYLYGLWPEIKSYYYYYYYIIEEIKPTIPLEPLIKKKQLSYFGHITRRDNSMEKSIMLGMGGGTRKRGRPRAR